MVVLQQRDYEDILSNQTVFCLEKSVEEIKWFGLRIDCIKLSKHLQILRSIKFPQRILLEKFHLKYYIRHTHLMILFEKYF